jgi:anti-sigma regulatory factor (Ser/Thr protein kinase)
METSVEIEGANRAADVRRAVADVAARLRLDETTAGRAALVGTEMATNIAKYGKRGSVAVDAFDDRDGVGVQLLATDSGPGIANFELAARDGHSTGGSLGLGLGVLRRNADVFDHYSVEQRGAALLARVRRPGSEPARAPGRLDIGWRMSPKPGQEQSGDNWTAKRAGRWQRVSVIDGLGHGPLAATASAEAVAAVQASMERDGPEDVLAAAHRQLKNTRGAVMSVVDVDTASGVVRFAGIGNITGLIWSAARAQHLLPAEGIVGYNMQRLRTHEYRWAPNAVLVLASDGLSSRLQFEPALMGRHPALIAGVLFRDHLRTTDDATVVVAKVVA